MAIKGKKSSTKSPPIFSNEFIIQNHADIVSCVAMVFVIGFFMNFSQPYAAPFVTLQHNVTELHAPVVLYAPGMKDLCFIFFAVLIVIVLHAILQEYVLDKLNRKVHLSRAKHVKFSMSGQLVTFYGLCAIWAANILNNDGFLPLSSLWAGFPGAPHDSMLFTVKLFFLTQVAYWLHLYAELYFEKVKRDEYLGRISMATVYSLLFLLAYGLNLWRVGLVLTLIHYVEQTLFHSARLAHFYAHPMSAKLFNLWNLVFLAARLLTTSLAFLVFWFGIPNSMFTLRVAGLSLIGATQLHMLFAFCKFHIGRWRAFKGASQKSKNKSRESKAKSKVEKNLSDDEKPPTAPSSPAQNVETKSAGDAPKDNNVKKRLKARA